MDETNISSDPHSPDESLTKNKKPFARMKRIGTLVAERWPEYLIEIVVVIIGITISFALNNFQTNAANHVLEETYLKGLQQDVQADIQELKETMERTNTVITSSEKILSEGKRENTILTKNELVNLVLEIASRPNFVSKNSTLSSLKSSANLPLIRDAALKNLLFTYDQQYEGLKTVEFFEGQEVISLVAPVILKNIPLTRDAEDKWMEALSVERILGNVEFINSTIVRREKRRELFKGYAEILKTLTQIEEKLNENLSSR